MNAPITFTYIVQQWGSNFILPGILTAVIAYFCGCFNGAVIVSQYILRDDVRQHGSGNAGLTNFHRTFGGPLTAIVILFDVLKAVAALLISAAVFRHTLGNNEPIVLFAKYWAAVFCLLGHMFPCMFHFRGGKGILSGGTIAILADWRIALIVWGIFLILTVLTRYVSLGSVSVAAAFPFATIWFHPGQTAVILLGFLCGGLIVWKHWPNIRRLLNGTENKFSLHKKKD